MKRREAARRAACTAVLGLSLSLALGAPAFAKTLVDQAIQELQTKNIFVHPDAEVTLNAAELGSVQNALGEVLLDIKIAILPGAAVSEVREVGELPIVIARSVNGAIGVIAGRNFRANSSENSIFVGGIVADAATSAFNQSDPAREGVAPMLVRWIENLDRNVASGQGRPSQVRNDDFGFPGNFGTPSVAPPPIFIFAFGLIALIIVGSFVAKALGVTGGATTYASVPSGLAGPPTRRLGSLSSRKRHARVELSVLDTETTTWVRGTSKEADVFVDKALMYRESAYAEMSTVNSQDDMSSVDLALRRSRHAMDCARATLDGHELPPWEDAEPLQVRHGGKNYWWSEGGNYEGVVYSPGYYGHESFWLGALVGTSLPEVSSSSSSSDDRSSSDSGGGSWSSSSSDSGGGSWGDSGGGSSGGGDSGGGSW